MKKIYFTVLFILTASIAIHAQYDSTARLKTAYLHTISSLKSPAAFTSTRYQLPKPGFFCRQEIVLQKAIKLPLYFRLGSLQYCNTLEGKNK